MESIGQILPRAIQEVQVQSETDPPAPRLASVGYTERWREWVERQEIPSRLWSASFETGEPSSALTRVLQFIEGEELRDGCCLALMGPTGIGKTYAMVAGLRTHYRGGGQFWYFPALCSAVLDRENGREVFTSARNTRLLALDDLGVEYLKAGGMLEALIDELFWYREGNSLATMVTTNLLPEQLRDRLSDRVVDRLRGDWGRLYVVTGQSYRGRETT